MCGFIFQKLMYTRGSGSLDEHVQRLPTFQSMELSKQELHLTYKMPDLKVYIKCRFLV
jgi:hypothetical protein